MRREGLQLGRQTGLTMTVPSQYMEAMRKSTCWTLKAVRSKAVFSQELYIVFPGHPTIPESLPETITMWRKSGVSANIVKGWLYAEEWVFREQLPVPAQEPLSVCVPLY